MPYDKRLHHRRSIRLRSHDYSTPDYYFITICTADKKCIFGQVANGEMRLNKCGAIAKQYLNELETYYHNVRLHEFVIMPNHMHAMIEILDVGAGFPRPECVNIGSGRGNPAPTLANMVAWFKYQSTKNINKLYGFAGKKLWQRNYYEHIVRDNSDYENIRAYIINNPRTWDSDVLYQKQLNEFNKAFE
jgi:REP element-mobilizing transposase RayT